MSLKFNNLAEFVFEFFCDSRRILATFAKFCLNSLFATWSYRYPNPSVFREAWSPELTSQSFPVSCFGAAVLYPTGSEIWCFWHIKTRGRKIAIEKKNLSAHWGDLIEQIKKICHIHFKPLPQSESWCSSFHMKMQIKHIFIWMVVHQASLWWRRISELGKGLNAPLWLFRAAMIQLISF